MSTKGRGLGRGLDALLGGASAAPQPGDQLREIPLAQLHAGKHQPRRAFDDAALAEMAASIRAQGVLQPIVVRPAGPNKFEIIAGERRFRAAKLASLSVIPAVVRNLDERGAMAAALVENIQRSDLNPLEESLALYKLIKECGLTHDKCAEAVGRSRAHVSNLLRLMELGEDVQLRVRAGEVSFGHAKVLLGVSGARQSSLAKLVAEQHISVRQLEALVQAEGASAKKPAKPAAHKLESELSERIGLPVRFQQSDKGSGKLSVSFKNKQELDKLLKLFG